MSGERVRPHLGLDVWQAEVLRLTVFRVPGGSDAGLALWESVGGGEPEFKTLKPKVGERQEAGPFGAGKLLLHVQPDRTDWLYALDQRTETGEAAPESFPVSVELFARAMREWLEGYNSVHRLAFGAVLDLPVRNREEGYERISAYLPFTVDARTSTDFLYQINRQRESEVIPGLIINRLSKWSVGLLLRQTIRLNVLDGGVALFPDSERHRCLIELDVNTQSDFPGQLPANQLAALFEELVGLGRELVREGDIP